MRYLLSLAALVPLVLCNRVALSSLPGNTQATEADSEQRRELLYLPSGESLEVLSLGYKNAFSDYLWFKAINYFGAHINSDRNLPWLYHFCDIVTTLNPRAMHVYEFGSTMLSWELGRPEESLRLLNRAIAHSPENWRLFYLRGFNQMYFLKNPHEAKKDFLKGANIKDAPPFLATLAAKKALELDEPEQVIPLLTQLLSQTKETGARKTLQRRLDDAVVKRDIKVLRMGVDIHKERVGSLPQSLEDLFARGIVQGKLIPPDGGQYVLEPSTGEVSYLAPSREGR